MRERPLSSSCGARWLVAAMVPSLITTAQASIASATIGPQNGVDAVVPSSPRSQQSKKPRRERYQEQRQQRIEEYEIIYDQYRTERRQRTATESPRQLQDAATSTDCTLCYDGTTVPNPEQTSTTIQGWTCGTLQNFVGGNLATGETECLEFQTVGSTDCSCPTSPLDTDYCALCPVGDGSVQLIPDSYLELPIPVTDTQPTADLTCADLIFLQQNGGAVPCADVATYQRYCGCPGATSTNPAPPPTLPASTAVPATAAPTGGTVPGATVEPSTTTAAPTLPPDPILAAESPTAMPTASPRNGDNGFECFMCPDQNPPEYQDRTLPYLTPAPSPRSNSLPLYNEAPPGQIITCGVLASQAELVQGSTQCYDYIFPEVPLDLQSYCGCSSGKAWDLCSLCMERQPLANPDLAVPGTGGLTCIELQEYIRYITDEESCNSIADTARDVCCTPLPDCPVCVNPVFTYNEDKLYPPLGLRCSELSLAQSVSSDNITCSEIQDTFGWYCECPNAVAPSCSLCGKELPDPSLAIPALGPGVTCGEVNDYASLRTEEACQEELASWSVDVQAYCGCPGFEARDDCRVQCPADLFLNRDALIPDSATGIAVNGYLTCGELVDLAPFVNDPDLCLAMQGSVGGCCSATPDNKTASDAEDFATADGDSAGGSRLGGGGDVWFVSYPFLGDGHAGNSSTSDDAYSREFITSPYRASTRYSHSSAAVRLGSLASPWIAAVFCTAVVIAAGFS